MTENDILRLKQVIDSGAIVVCYFGPYLDNGVSRVDKLREDSFFDEAGRKHPFNRRKITDFYVLKPVIDLDVFNEEGGL